MSVEQTNTLDVNRAMVKVAFPFFRNGRKLVEQIAFVFAVIGGMSGLIPVSATAASVAMPQASARLLPGTLEKGTAYIGIEIALVPGVKTYWRMPGDSGLPPAFDWSASENLSRAAIEWPLPERIADPAGTVLGYHDRVVFPVRIEAKDASKPVRLSLKLDYAVCAEICVPLSAEISALLEAKPVDPNFSKDIDAFRARVPITSTIGGAIKPTLKSLAQAGPDLMQLTLDTPVKDLILEGPDGWYFGDASPQSATIWQIKILQKPSNAMLSDLQLILTLIGDKRATETALTLDASGAIR